MPARVDISLRGVTFRPSSLSNAIQPSWLVRARGGLIVGSSNLPKEATDVAQYSAADKADMTVKAVELYAKNYSFRAIGRELGITHPTAEKWIEDEYARRAEHREHDREKHLSVYDEIQSAAWEAFKSTGSGSLNRSGYLNTIKACEDSKVKSPELLRLSSTRT